MRRVLYEFAHSWCMHTHVYRVTWVSKEVMQRTNHHNNFHSRLLVKSIGTQTHIRTHVNAYTRECIFMNEAPLISALCVSTLTFSRD